MSSATLSQLDAQVNEQIAKDAKVGKAITEAKAELEQAQALNAARKNAASSMIAQKNREIAELQSGIKELIKDEESKAEKRYNTVLIAQGLKKEDHPIDWEKVKVAPLDTLGKALGLGKKYLNRGLNIVKAGMASVK